MVKNIEDVNLWRDINLTKSKKKPAEGSYCEDIDRLHETMEKGVKFII